MPIKPAFRYGSRHCLQTAAAHRQSLNHPLPAAGAVLSLCRLRGTVSCRQHDLGFCPDRVPRPPSIIRYPIRANCSTHTALSHKITHLWPSFVSARCMGEVRGASADSRRQTQRAVENFPISGWPLPPELIHALGLVKYAAAIANRDLGKLSRRARTGSTPRRSTPCSTACREVADGKFDDQFPIDVFQTGSGTSSNMNANEVISNRAIELCGGDRFGRKSRSIRTIT